MRKERHVVTGAFGYSGRYIAERLLFRGHEVLTLTNSPVRTDIFGRQVQTCPLCFHDPEALTESLRGAHVLYNTYWVRFNHSQFTHLQAVENTRILFDCARRAGVRRIVHVSITNPSIDSPLEYFRGKAQLEEVLKGTGLSYAILRPAVLFGHNDILINNIAWALRRLPLFGVFGDGSYGIRPIHVEDLADLAVAQGEATENMTVDAVGPENFSYRNLVNTVGEIIDKRRAIISVSPSVGYAVASIIGKIVGDVFLTMEEIEGLMAGLLASGAPATGKVALTKWARENRDALGRRYANELARRTEQ